MPIEILLFLALALQTKHLIADFLLQTKGMVATKGIYGHPVGFSHSALHGVLTWPCLVVAGVPPLLALAISVVEIAFHYHVDWGKQALTKALKVEISQARFWHWLGADQFVHQVSYIAMLYVVFQMWPQ